MAKVILTDKQNAYCKERIRERVEKRELVKKEISLKIGKNPDFLANYLKQENKKASVDTIYKLFAVLHLPFDEIFKSDKDNIQINYIVVRSDIGMFYGGDVTRYYVNYGKTEICCMRFVDKVKDAKYFKTRQEAEKTAKKIKNSKILKRKELRGVVTWN